MSPVCRICLAGNTRLQSIKNNQLIDFYGRLSNTKFNSEDARPRALCCFCYQKLLRCHTFSQMVCRSEKIFSDLCSLGIEATQECITVVNLGMKQQFSMAAVQSFTIDAKTTNAGSQVTIKQEPCSIEIKEEVTTEQHISREVESVPEDLAKSQTTSEEDNSDPESDVYDLPSNSPTEQTELVNSKNPSIKAFACNVCDKKFKRRNHFVAHIRIHTGEKPFGCNVCNKHFTQQGTLLNHVKIHTGEKRFACNVCKKQFIQRFQLVEHARIHTGEKPYACNVCDKRFKHSAYFITHMRTHTGGQAFACNECGKKYNRRANLVSHMRIHTVGRKIFACKLCDKQFYQKFNLNSHNLKKHREAGLNVA